MTKDKDIKTVVPALRFPEFRDADAWEYTTLESLGIFLRGLTYNAGDIAEDSLLVLRSTNIQDGKLLLDTDLVFVDKKCHEYLLLRKGDIVICMSNGSKPLVGKNAEYYGNNNNQQITIGAFCSLFRPKNRLARFALQTRDYEKFVSLAIGGGNINNLKNSDLEKYPLYFPPEPKEQTKIANCLVSLDDLISAVADKIEALKEHKKGLMQQLFPAEGKTTPALRFPEFQNAGEWKETTLGAIGEIITGNTPSTKDSSYYGGDKLFVSPADISDKRYVSQTKTTLTKKGFCVSRHIKENSILFVCIGSTIGKVAQNTIECATNQQINSLIPYKGYVADFVYSILEYYAPKIASIAGNQAVPIINKTLFASVSLLTPKEDEQRRIADCLSSVDQLISAETDKLDQLKAHKKGLMQQLFPTINE